ncbi:hypothetical protein BESB_040530 [Besnoitia besnoiti]|uniref:Gpi16 subunit, GPI transamidase component protein n=1 Tax=Besnoitia besnoiti TaxID=94643 RepID=A0A2A9MHY4_BESBE|nr:hypothetical protein BESB_040530 [Besnoitia besnoiti]PFH37595.1 hypothetical protein BESB_040530 [Besnoitia besnoiti]
MKSIHFTDCASPRSEDMQGTSSPPSASSLSWSAPPSLSGVRVAALFSCSGLFSGVPIAGWHRLRGMRGPRARAGRLSSFLLLASSLLLLVSLGLCDVRADAPPAPTRRAGGADRDLPLEKDTSGSAASRGAVEADVAARGEKMEEEEKRGGATQHRSQEESAQKDGGRPAQSHQADDAAQKDAAINEDLDVFTENLYLQSLKNESLFVAHFDFRLKTKIPLASEKAAITRHQHYDIFPKEIGKLLTLHLQQDVSLLASPSAALPASLPPPILFFDASLTQGRWPEAAWGPPPTPVKPPGALLRAALSTNPLYDSQRTWSLLTHSLGGVMCTAFSMLKNEDLGYALSAAVLAGFDGARGALADWGGAAAAADEGDVKAPWKLQVAASPVEVACTENLSSLRELLPCRGEAGLLSLAHPLAVASSPFKTLRLLAFTEEGEARADGRGRGAAANAGGADDAFLRVELRALLTVVLEAPKAGQVPFSLADLFHLVDRQGARAPLRSCVAASASRVFLRLPRSPAAGRDRPEKEGSKGHEEAQRDAAALASAAAAAGGSMFAVYEVDESSDLVIFDAFAAEAGREGDAPRSASEILRFPGMSGSALEIERQQTGRGTLSSKLERMEGAWLLVFRNRSELSRSIRYFDSFPPFIFPLLHTARLSWKPLKSKSRAEGDAAACEAAFRSARATHPFRAGSAAARALNLRLQAPSSSFIENPVPASLSLAFALPPRCQLEFSVGVEKRYWPASRFAFSPDKGSDVGGAIVLDRPSSQFYWPPPASVLSSPLTCRAGSACASLPLRRGLSEGAETQGQQATESGGMDVSLEVAAEGLYAPGQRDSWNWHLTEGMIVHLPLPDFSMPFNVIALSGTVLTLFYGSVFRITTMEW